MPNLIQERDRQRERWVRGDADHRRRLPRRRSSDATLLGEEVVDGEALIRRWRWAARVLVPFGPVLALARDGGGGGERRGGAFYQPRANPRSVGM